MKHFPCFACRRRAVNNAAKNRQHDRNALLAPRERVSIDQGRLTAFA